LAFAATDLPLAAEAATAGLAVVATLGLAFWASGFVAAPLADANQTNDNGQQGEENLLWGQSLLQLWAQMWVSMQESQLVLGALCPLHRSHPMTPSHPRLVEPAPLRSMPPNRLVHLGQPFPQQWVQVQVWV